MALAFASGSGGGSVAVVWLNFTPVLVGFSATTANAARYNLTGHVCIIEFQIVGTSNAATFTASLPVTASANIKNSCGCAFAAGDSGGTDATPGRCLVLPSGTVASFARGWDGGTAWTASGTKSATVCTLTYEV